MNLKCELCGETVVVADDIEPGQHVRCPFCDGKFTYAAKREITEDDLRKALAECRKDPEQDRYYKNAPAGARLYIGLVFYGLVFKDVLNKEQFVSAFTEIGNELKERDLRYLLQYEDDAEMREYLSDRLAAICGRAEEVIVQPAAKTRKHPKLGIIREKKPEPQVPPVVVEAVRPEPVPSEPAAKGFDAKTVFSAIALIAAVAIAAWFVIGAWREHDRAAEQERYERWKSSEQAKRTDEDSAKRDETAGAAKQDERQRSLDAFLAYMGREKKLLSDSIRESSGAYDEILRDQKKLAETMIRLETENARRSEIAATNGWKRYDKAEMVMIVLKDADMNALALKYLGEDFTALRAECRGRIKSVLEMQSKTERRLALNRAKYRNRLEGIEDDVDRKTTKAQEITASANKDLEKRLSELESQRAKRQEILERLKKKENRTKAVVEEINALQSEVSVLDKEISRVGEIVAVSRANVAHIAATAAETLARRKADAALSARQEDDNAVHADMAHERSVFDLAMTYEGRSLDRLCEAIRSRKDTLFVRMTDAQRKFDMLEQSLVNADLLSPEQMDAMKTTLAEKLKTKILDAVQ